MSVFLAKSAKVGKILSMKKSLLVVRPIVSHCMNVTSSSAAGKRWLLHMGLGIERPDNLNVCLNCIQILRDERTTGLEENCDGERGSFVVNSAGSDDRLQSYASSLHQPVSGA